MSFPHCSKAFRSGNTYKPTIPTKISVNVENINTAWKESVVQENNLNNNRFSPKLIEDRTRANLESLNEQISSLTQLLSQLINNNSAKTSPTAGSHTTRPAQT